MGGSVQWFLYETDVPGTNAGEYKWLPLKMDESNALLFGGLKNTTANRAGKEFLSASDGLIVEPRYVLAEGRTAGGRTVRRKLTVCDPNNSLWQSGGTISLAVMTGGQAANVENVVFNLTFSSGEKRRYSIDANPDTGLDDTTQP